MSASQATIVVRNSTNAEFQAWGNLIASTLLAAGWTKVYSDYGAGTGWGDVAAPAQNTFGVTEIWRSPAESGLTQFYMKLRYGSHNHATVGPALEWSFSWSWTSGSSLGGTPTTAVDSRNVGTPAAANSTARLCTVAAGPGEFALSLGGGAAVPCAHLIAVERTRNAALAKQDELAILSQYNPTASIGVFNNKVYTAEGYEWTDTNGTGSSYSWYPNMPTAAQQVSRGSVGLQFATPTRGYRTSPMSIYMGTNPNTVGANGEQIPITVYGVSRNFIILGGGGSGAPGQWAAINGGDDYGLILFE